METEEPVEDVAAALRSNWKFPAVVHFCRVFEGVLSLRQFSSDKFEAALLNPGAHSVFLSELISRLLYPGRKKNSLNPETWPTWETNLLKKVRTHWNLTMDHNPLERQQHFVEVSSSEKLEILYLLTEIALLNSTTLRDTIRNTVEDPLLTADSVRCLPIGEDAEGSRYFLFSLRYEDCRLYKQVTSRSKATAETDLDPPEWVTLTTTLEELKAFVTELRRAKHPSEKKLCRYLVGILPEFERTERHRKKVEDRAALREQAPLLKRSSRLQEQVKKKEKARGPKTKDVDMADIRHEDGGEDGQNCYDLGISREERMRLRNQRRELAEKGLRRVLTGRKRGLEYDGLTPLGTSVRCPRKKRIQDVRPSRNITKLVSIIWEKFRRPMHHRKQFDIHLEATKKKRAAMIQNRNDFMLRAKFSQRPLDVSPSPLTLDRVSVQNLGSMRDTRLPPQSPFRPPFVQQPSVLVSYLQQQQQKPQQRGPFAGSYSFGSLQMPRPLQTTADVQRPSDGPGLASTLQPPLMRYAAQPRDVALNYAIPQRSPGFPDALRRQMLHPQHRAYDFGASHGIILPHKPPEHQGLSRSPPFPPNYTQRMAEVNPLRNLGAYSHHPEPSHHTASPLNGLRGFPPTLRTVPSQLPQAQLSQTLARIPNPLHAAVKQRWNGHLGGSPAGSELPKMPYGQPHLPHGTGHGHGEILRPGMERSFGFDHGARWQTQPHHPQLYESGHHSGTLPAHFMKRKRNE